LTAEPPRRARWLARVVTASAWIAGVCFAAMVLLTVADVSLRAMANWPIRGVYELVELLLAAGFFFALPATFLREEHIVVDIVDTIAPGAVPALKRLAGAVAIVTLALMGWQSWVVAADSLAFGDVTADLALPRIVYWVPVVAGIIGSAFAALVSVTRRGRPR
jgi:TRAP-type C4-dicarboxylate transport system permease small subunit